uniref:(northern house mosquito) hypothetical protein n=1 Tax=Culex pipiens TaxID=7175 RepID=A0A8D8G8F8_CULPI
MAVFFCRSCYLQMSKPGLPGCQINLGMPDFSSVSQNKDLPFSVPDIDRFCQIFNFMPILNTFLIKKYLIENQIKIVCDFQKGDVNSTFLRSENQLNHLNKTNF